ncbi:MAG: enoyl-ACP reductase [Acidobacteria bacterium]|nr:enoyl-ACP reductase [Acidobacteriota bacterium]MCB9398160.1 enoyl-ACP reductase [Acidobacteriota bacterium]
MLNGKKILVTGVANHRSIAWAIAKYCLDQGAQVCITYQNERLRSNAEKLVGDLPILLLPCDVSQEEEVSALFATLQKDWGSLDGLVHSIAFANKEDLKGAFHETSRAGFGLAHDVSSFSLVILSHYAKPLMEAHGGSIICMSYLGGERVFQNYNVMGVAKASLEMAAKYLASELGPNQIRVNIVSPGPIRTLAAAGIGGFSPILDHVVQTAPLRRNINQEEVAKASAFLLSDLASGITGETIHVDAGYHIMGM